MNNGSAGERSSDKFSIAMKFSPWEHKSVMDREFEMYTYLHAVNKTNVEQYGISPILYYKKLQWEDDEYMLAVFSFFDGGHLLDMSKKGHFSHAANDPNVINSLIIFRDFVSIYFLLSAPFRIPTITVEMKSQNFA